MKAELKKLSSLEHEVLNVIWKLETCTAEQIRRELESFKEFKDSTVRTILRRLEEKGYVAHETQNRTFVYHSAIEKQNAAIEAVRQVIKKFCNGSAKTLLVGMVADELISSEELKELTEQITHLQNNGEKQR